MGESRCIFHNRGYHLEAACRFSEGMRMLNAGEYEAAVYAFSVALPLTQITELPISAERRPTASLVWKSKLAPI